MAIKEKITQSQLRLYEILKHPTLCGEFIENLDKTPHEERFEFSSYQNEMMCDFASEVSFTCARSVGKTRSLVHIIIWAMINNVFPEDYITYHVPGKNHAEPVFTGLVRLLRTNSLLRNFLPNKSGINNADLVIKLDNGSSLLCRIAGQTGTGLPVVGLHTPLVIVDEAAYYNWGTWLELQPTQNRFTSGHRIIASGVPVGLREKNVLYHVDQVNESYTKHRISALQNPRFTKADFEEAKIIYGSEDSDDFIHIIYGQHGKPVFSLFSRESMFIETYPVYQMAFDGATIGLNLAEYINKLNLLPGLPSRDCIGLMGIDLGYTDPTAIFVMYLDPKDNKFRFHAKITLNKVNFTIQDRIIDFLDTKYAPSLIGIDKSTIGIPVVHRLMEDIEFTNKNYEERMFPVIFSANVVIGMDQDGEEINMKTKPLSVTILQEYVLNGKIVFSSTDMDTIVELERMTYTKNQAGELIYKTLTERGGKAADDHFTSALLCASLAHHMKTDAFILHTRSKKLFQPRWIVSGG